MKKNILLRYFSYLLASIGVLSGMSFGVASYAQDDEQSQEVAPPPQEVDPWQNFNRRVFAFNDGVDKYLLRPIAVGYKAVMPDPLERGVTNIFDNVMEVPSVINGVMQGNLGGAAHDTGRLLVNTTLGLGGLLDVARYMKLPADDPEDFGQTLAVWGVGSGPYLVLPLLGPSTIRDGVGRPVDWYLDPTTYIEHVRTSNTVKGISILDTRAGLLSLEKNITGDKYTFFRDVYLQRREYLINNGKVEDDFGAEDDFDMEEF
jgi:phospholipid-binding lipoprotein MlaA